MIKSHEQQMELRLPRIGTIRKGAPKPEKGPGKDLEYFRLDRTDPAVAAAWHEVFGQQPKTISGILPYGDPAENLSIWDELWQGKRLLWRGDGERLHVQLQGNSYVRYAPGDGPAQPAAAGQMVDRLKVARVSRLRLLLPQLRVAGIFEVMSSSAIDADELWANLMWIRSTVATLQGAPITVYRAERQFNVAQPDGKTMIVKKHMLHMMLDGRYLDALLPAPGGTLVPLLSAPVALAATTGQSDDDAPEDGEYEDAPTTTVKTTPPTPAATKPQPPFASGPQSDEDAAISEANGDFANVAAAFLGTDALTIKRRMGELRLSVPRTGQQRIEVYRALKADMGAADDIMAAAGTQPSLVTVAQPVTDYQE